MTTAIVLGGGGSKGSFEVGALRYLYEKGIRPQIVCGTSVGAINGAKLAEGGDDRAFLELEQLWLGMRENKDMYEPQPWLATLSDKAQEVIKLASSEGLKTGGIALAKWLLLPPSLIADLIALGIDIAKVVEAVDKAKSSPSLYRLAGIQAKIDGGVIDPLKIKASGIKLRIAAACLDTGETHYVTEEGHVLDRRYQPVSTTLRRTDGPLSPECQALEEQIALLEADIRALQASIPDIGGLEPETGSPSLSETYQEIQRLSAEIAELSAQLRACMEESGSLVTGPLSVPLRQAVIASASMPAVFPPVSLGNMLYTDGGVRENLPLKAALDLGATRVFCIAAGPEGLARKDCRGMNSVEILLRSIDMMLDEVGEGDAAIPHGTTAEVTMIRPVVEVHDGLTVDATLIRINMDYGYMRAADATIKDPQLRAVAEELSDEIASLRSRIYFHRHDASLVQQLTQ